jgi:hypothetical protein
MAASRFISASKFREAAAFAREIEESMALTVNRFDPSRMPKLTFKKFPTGGATVAVSPESSFRFSRARSTMPSPRCFSTSTTSARRTCSICSPRPRNAA